MLIYVYVNLRYVFFFRNLGVFLNCDLVLINMVNLFFKINFVVFCNILLDVE